MKEPLFKSRIGQGDSSISVAARTNTKPRYRADQQDDPGDGPRDPGEPTKGSTNSGDTASQQAS